MEIIKSILLFVIAFACCVAALFLYLLWDAKTLAPIGPDRTDGYSLELLAINITILEIVLALVGFLIAVVGLFGYAGIKSAATNEARKTANQQMLKWINEQNQKGKDTQTESSGDFNVGDAPTDEAVPAGKEE